MIEACLKADDTGHMHLACAYEIIHGVKVDKKRRLLN